MSLDSRLHAYRADLADVRLQGRVQAERFVEGARYRVIAPNAPLRRRPQADAPLDSEVLRGEVFTVFERGPEGWSWGQLETDGYVGYAPSDALSATSPEPTHRIAVLRTFVFPGPDMKLPAQALLSYGTALALDETAETRVTRYRRIVGGEGWIVGSTADPLDAAPENDFVVVAERFLNAAYLWGGRTSVGLDCSALVQLALMGAGIAAPRDTDLQEAALGSGLEGGAEAALRRGDLVFWKGHVGIMIDGEYLLHATGHRMMTVIEPLQEVAARIANPVSSVRRLARYGA